MNDLFELPPVDVVAGKPAGDLRRTKEPGVRAGTSPAANRKEPSPEQVVGDVGAVKGSARTATRTPPARDAGPEDEDLPEDPLQPLTDAQWARVLGGRRVRWLVNMTEKQFAWASKRAVSCGACAYTHLQGNPRRGYCTAGRVMVSTAFPVLCMDFKKS